MMMAPRITSSFAHSGERFRTVDVTHLPDAPLTNQPDLPSLWRSARSRAGLAEAPGSRRARSNTGHAGVGERYARGAEPLRAAHARLSSGDLLGRGDPIGVHREEGVHRVGVDVREELLAEVIQLL